ncbi:serine/threonine-protein kinase [Streptomyces sp. NPDC086077]|uniref:serine/threonine-protein kinase n=1 Tax=Streptomyces sp. NPDC086077 TaxID=3154862 RepID=UPI0034392E9E
MGSEGSDERVIAGRYRLQATVGRGGMGVVWRATDQLLGREVAVKELVPDDSPSAARARSSRDRTLREARALAQLRHPHISVVHDVVEDDERLYIVMELIDGGSLADRIAADGPVDAREAARIGIALLGALRAAHEAGVLHRDLKPANVLIESGTGRVVLTDFGVAQVEGATTLTESGTFVGSPEYTAPERMSGSGTGPASDLWSLGVLLCTSVSGESPFHRDSLGGLLHAVVAAPIRPPAQAGPMLPVVLGLLERDPERRLDAAQAERMLRDFLETGRAPEPVRSQRTSRDRVVIVLLVAAMVAVSAAALFVNGGAGDGDGPPVSPTPSTSLSTSASPSASGSNSPPE